MANLELTFLDTNTKADGLRSLHEVLNTNFEILRQMLNAQDSRLTVMENLLPTPPVYEENTQPPE